MSAELRCANCNQRLDATDKFCRECGLPTVHRAETQRLAAAAPPDADELRRALEVEPDKAAFAPPPGAPRSAAGPELTTGSVVKVTSPTFAAQMAGTTAVMVGLIVVLVVIGIAMIVLAVKF